MSEQLLKQCLLMPSKICRKEVYMEKVIDLLSEIEEKADQIIKRAGEEKNKLYQELEQNMKSFDKSIEEERTSKLAALKQQADSALEKERQALIEDCNKQINHIETYYKDNYDALADNILKKLLS